MRGNFTYLINYALMNYRFNAVSSSSVSGTSMIFNEVGSGTNVVLRVNQHWYYDQISLDFSKSYYKQITYL